MKHTRKNQWRRKRGGRPWVEIERYFCGTGHCYDCGSSICDWCESGLARKAFRADGAEPRRAKPVLTRLDDWRDPDDDRPQWLRPHPWYFGAEVETDWPYDFEEYDPSDSYFDPRQGESFLRDPVYAA